MRRFQVLAAVVWRIQVLWGVNQCHWMSDSQLLIHNAFIFKDQAVQEE